MRESDFSTATPELGALRNMRRMAIYHMLEANPKLWIGADGDSSVDSNSCWRWREAFRSKWREWRRVNQS